MYLCGTMNPPQASASRPSMIASISARSLSSRVISSSCDVPRNAMRARVDVLVHRRARRAGRAPCPVRWRRRSRRSSPPWCRRGGRRRRGPASAPPPSAPPTPPAPTPSASIWSDCSRTVRSRLSLLAKSKKFHSLMRPPLGRVRSGGSLGSAEIGVDRRARDGRPRRQGGDRHRVVERHRRGNGPPAGRPRCQRRRQLSVVSRGGRGGGRVAADRVACTCRRTSATRRRARR